MSWGRTVSLPAEEAPWVYPEQPRAETVPQVEASTQYASPSSGGYDGETFWKGVTGFVDELEGLDHYTLRKRSAALFNQNMYAAGIIRCLVDNVINTGLEVECIPEEAILGLPEDTLNDWSELIENRYHLYGQAPEIIDAKGSRNDGALQRQIYAEALIDGDCVVVCDQDTLTQLPQTQIIPGNRVSTPLEHVMDPAVVDGVRLDKRGRHLGYYIYQGTSEVFNDQYKYVSCIGKNSGRKTAWMVYGAMKREDGVRGVPILSVAIQGINDIGQFKGSSLLKAKINSMIVGSVKNTQDTNGIPIGKGASKSTTERRDHSGATSPVKLNYIEPGIWVDKLEHGEELSAYAVSGSDVNFGPFEAAIVAGIAWALRIPPEILTLSFSSNYSASQAALQEFKIYLNMERTRFASQHCQNLFVEWFISEMLLSKFQAGQFLEAYQDPTRYDEVHAWTLTDWSGAIKPSVDLVKTVNGYKGLTSEGWITNDKTSRELTNTKFSKNIRRLKKENEMKRDALAPIAEAIEKNGADAVAKAMKLLGMGSFDASDTVEEAAA